MLRLFLLSFLFTNSSVAGCDLRIGAHTVIAGLPLYTYIERSYNTRTFTFNPDGTPDVINFQCHNGKARHNEEQPVNTQDFYAHSLEVKFIWELSSL